MFLEKLRVSCSSHGRREEGSKMQGAVWSQGAETSLSGLSLLDKLWPGWAVLCGKNFGQAVLFHLLVSLSWFPLQQLRPISVSWDWTKGWGGGRGALVPAQAFRARGLSALTLHVVGPGPWWVLARSRLALSHLAEPHRSALSSVSWLSCKGTNERNLLSCCSRPPARTSW